MPPEYRAEVIAKRAAREKEAEILFQAIRENASTQGPIWQLKDVNTHAKDFTEPKKDLAGVVSSGKT